MRDVVGETWMVVLLGTALYVAALGRDHANVRAVAAKDPRLDNPWLAALEWAFWLTGLYLKSHYRAIAFPPLKIFYCLVYLRLSYLSWNFYTYFFYNFVTIRIIGDQLPVL